MFVNVVASIQYRALANKANDAFYKLSNTRSQIQAYVFDGKSHSSEKKNKKHVLIKKLIILSFCFVFQLLELVSRSCFLMMSLSRRMILRKLLKKSSRRYNLCVFLVSFGLLMTICISVTFVGNVGLRF